MKKILILGIAAFMFSSPAFAMPAASSSSQQSATISTGSNKATQTNIVGQTDLDKVNVVTNGDRNLTDIGVISNKGADQTNVINKVQMKNSNIITKGDDNKTRVGGVYNEN